MMWTVAGKMPVRKIQTDVEIISTANVRIMTTGRIELGPTGRQVAANVKRLREARGLTLRSLSVCLREAGRPLSADALNKIENGRSSEVEGEKARPVRRVDVDDLMALAGVFNVSPLALLLPMRTYAPGTVELTSTLSATLDDAWDWGAGASALPQAAGGTVDTERQAEYERLSLPENRRHVAQHTTGRRLRVVTKLVSRLILGVNSVRWDHRGPDAFQADVEDAKAEIEHLKSEVDLLVRAHDRVLEDMREIQRQGAVDWEQHVRDHPEHGHGSTGGGDG